MHMGKRKFNYIHASNLHTLLERDFRKAAGSCRVSAQDSVVMQKIHRLLRVLEALSRDRLVFITIIAKLQNSVL